MTKRIALCTFIMGGLSDLKGVWGSWLNTVKGPIDLVVIDNAAYLEEQQESFLDRFIHPFWPGNVFYFPQDDNLGVIKSMQFCYEQCPDYDIYAFIHNDVFVYKPGWDREVVNIFDYESRVGLVGFFGAEGIHPSSGRYNVWNNMLEAEIHGGRMVDGYREVAVLDGMSMFASKEMLDERNGIDTTFTVHHFYDLDLSLESIDRGYRNFAIATPIHHWSGVTACKPIFQEWANKLMGMEQGEQAIYQNNLLLWKKKWAKRLPWQVGMEWR